MYNIYINVHLRFLHPNIKKQIVLLAPIWIINPVEYKQCILDQTPLRTPVERVITCVLSNSRAIRWQFIFNTLCFSR